MQQIHEVENELLNKGYKDLGWMNAWENDPVEYTLCCEAKHERENIILNSMGTLNISKCETCKIFHKVDSSD